MAFPALDQPDRDDALLRYDHQVLAKISIGGVGADRTTLGLEKISDLQPAAGDLGGVQRLPIVAQLLAECAISADLLAKVLPSAASSAC